MSATDDDSSRRRCADYYQSYHHKSGTGHQSAQQCFDAGHCNMYVSSFRVHLLASDLFGADYYTCAEIFARRIPKC